MHIPEVRAPRPLVTTLGGVALLAASLLSPRPVAAQEAQQLTINGYTNFEFEWMIDEEGAGDPNGSFDADMFDLVLGYQLSPEVRVAADLTWEHGTASEDLRGNVAVEYAFVEYVVAPALRFRFGKMLTPFGYYNELHTAKPALLGIKYASATERPSRLVDGSFAFYARFAAGVAVLGALPAGDGELDYNLMISNGEQEATNPFEEDNNGFKAVAARVRWAPAIDQEISASLYYDHEDGEETVSVLTGGLTARMAFDAFGFETEVALGRRNARVDPTQLQLGAYLMPWYRLGESGLTPYAVVGLVDADLDASDDLGVQLVGGVNIEAPGGLIFKLELNHFAGQGARYDLPGSGFTEIKAAASYMF